ncbi:class I SAM-dependent methyltransferase [Granulicella arctica]|uniref:class I SAM-dependent methyltransferase n=1 Tax=Granulicella arctica TaxID=940613 RepID=UPI0021DF4DDC|nr:class I SAM-dependent methyltransferase [Granulicella arctica]
MPPPSQSGPRLAPKSAQRPRDLLVATDQPIHPFDLAHGVDTSGLVPAKNLVTGHPNDEHVTAYYGVAPSILRALVAEWRATPPPEPIAKYTFVDIGAGKGRAMLVASELPFRQVVGIELNPAMAAIARQNLDHWLTSHVTDPTAPQLAPIDLLEQDALEFELPRTPTLLFLFHPFEAPVLRALLRRIETQFANRPGELDLLYVNAECAIVLDRNPGFKRLWVGAVRMSREDHAADVAAIAMQKEYGSTGDEECAIYRYVGRSGTTS